PLAPCLLLLCGLGRRPPSSTLLPYTTLFRSKVLIAEPNNTEALHGKGLTIDNFGNHTEAVDIYDKILEIEPDNMDALASKGVVLYNTGNKEEAIKNFEKVLTLNYSSSNRSFFNWGVTHYGLGNYKNAIESFRIALQIDPKNSLTLNNLGFALEISGKYEEAIKYFDLAALI